MNRVGWVVKVLVFSDLVVVSWVGVPKIAAC